MNLIGAGGIVGIPTTTKLWIGLIPNLLPGNGRGRQRPTRKGPQEKQLLSESKTENSMAPHFIYFFVTKRSHD